MLLSLLIPQTGICFPLITSGGDFISPRLLGAIKGLVSEVEELFHVDCLREQLGHADADSNAELGLCVKGKGLSQIHRLSSLQLK